MFEVADKEVAVGGLRRRLDLGAGGVFAAVGDVPGDRLVGEELSCNTMPNILRYSSSGMSFALTPSTKMLPLFRS